MNNIKETILAAFNSRHACKEFDVNKKISAEDFNFILETGRLSPSSFGFEPWKFLVIQNHSLREKILPLAWGAQRQLPSASHFLILLARKATHMHAGSKYTQDIMRDLQKLPPEIVTLKSDFFKKFQEQEFDLTDERKLFDWSSKQLYIPMANMMSCAAMLGIDSCPIEGFAQKELTELLATEGILSPTEFGVAAMLAFGYRLENSPAPVKTRQPITKVVEWF